MVLYNCVLGGSYIYCVLKVVVLNLGCNFVIDFRFEGIFVGIYYLGWVKMDMGGSLVDIIVDESVVGLIVCFDVFGM